MIFAADRATLPSESDRYLLRTEIMIRSQLCMVFAIIVPAFRIFY